MKTKTEETDLTDLEAFVNLYKRVGIIVETNIRENEIVIDLNGWSVGDEKTTESEKFGGYSGSCSEIVFDMEGKFLRQDFWEY